MARITAMQSAFSTTVPKSIKIVHQRNNSVHNMQMFLLHAS